MSGSGNGHCGDLNGDRALGERWEANFGALAVIHRSAWFTRNQKGNREAAHAEYLSAGVMKRALLPDVVIWTMPGEHHEIKHKNPYAYRGARKYGLKADRFDALLAFARQVRDPVMYTIHDWEKAGDRNGTVNDIRHWVTADITKLDQHKPRPVMGNSYRNGRTSREPIYYWPTRLWIPLADFWRQHQPTLWGAG